MDRKEGPNKDYLGAINCVTIDDIDEYSEEEYLAQEKKDGMFVRVQFEEDKAELVSRWNIKIEAGSVEDGLSSLKTGQHAVVVAELEAASQHSTKEFEKNGFRKIWLYDLLEWDFFDLRDQPLIARIHALKSFYEKLPEDIKERVKIAETAFTDFKSLYNKSWEGIMLKKKNSLYKSGRKDKKVRDWIKVKKMVSQSMVIIGFEKTKISGNITAQWGLWNGEKTVKCLVSGLPGLTEETKSEYLGRIADLKGFEVTQKGSLRSGQFEKWRDDLTIEDCVYNQDRTRS